LSIDLDFDSGQQALGDAVEQFCAGNWTSSDARQAGAAKEPEFSRPLWRKLAEMGVLAAGAPGEEGGALEVCAIMEALGRAIFPGPLAETYLAQQILPSSEAQRVGAGECLVALGVPPLLPWAAEADIFLEYADGSLHRGEPQGPVHPQESLGGEAWGRLKLRRGPALPGVQRGLTLGAIARSAYLAAAADRLVEDAATHAGSREQFGQSIGEFQAVAHPLADAHMRLAASRGLIRAAAYAFDSGMPGKIPSRAAVAEFSAIRSALQAVHTGHQVFGAVGITRDGPAFYISRRIRSLACQIPDSREAGAAEPGAA